ncbi:MAG: alpha/beta fold hydrolase [Desulfobacterales bacterium]|nr:alpha/beta fold hydrolase [Desulfobacterales bacterium]
MVEFESDTGCHPIAFSSDGFLLRGVLHRPPKTPAPPVVIGSHGLLSNGSSPKQIALAKRCAACGIAFFRFDHRGCGHSQGLFHDVTSLAQRCRDLLNAAATMAARNDIGPVVGLFGSSMGGAVSLSAAKTLGARAVVTVAAPVRSRGIAALEDPQMKNPALPTQGHVPPRTFDIAGQLHGLSHVLIVHGSADAVVPVENAHEIHRRVGNPKKLVIQPEGDHRMSDPGHQQMFADQAMAWFRRHLLSQSESTP